jgi:hypothetical protein
MVGEYSLGQATMDISSPLPETFILEKREKIPLTRSQELASTLQDLLW